MNSISRPQKEPQDMKRIVRDIAFDAELKTHIIQLKYQAKELGSLRASPDPLYKDLAIKKEQTVAHHLAALKRNWNFLTEEEKNEVTSFEGARSSKA